MSLVEIGKITFLKTKKKNLNTVITKSKDDQNLVFGFFNVTEIGDSSVIDYGRDSIDSDGLEKAVYDFVEKGGKVDVEHNGKPIGTIVESMFFSKEKQSSLGIDLGGVGWWGGFKIYDKAIWEDIKQGRLNMFSIAGRIISEG